ncbi:TetR/AcrR family transcriptional regulator [Streptosporangium sp. NPDC002524]|uniref:TetR/AcrR family transcriptional regulator n=1 Tax=Streptosporangium sp. NPDC002524 TaxID=3154537 RepID=UPI00332DBE26
MPDQAPSRRDEYAEMTRQEVIKAARKLYAVPGYAQTTVDKIAREARVSPATVYAQCGGKDGLLRTLMDIWTTSPTVGRIISDAAAAPTGRTKLEVLAAGYVAHAAEAGDIMRIVERAAPSSPAAQTFLDVADQRHIEALEMIVEGIAGNGDLAEGLSVEDAAKIIFFHFRNPQLVLAVETFGWGVERGTRWLVDRVAAAILKD